MKSNQFAEITDQNTFATLDDFIKSELVSFDKAKRPDLYRVSRLIEDHAQRAYEPLIATFETEHLYKYAEKHYLEILKNIPKTL